MEEFPLHTAMPNLIVSMRCGVDTRRNKSMEELCLHAAMCHLILNMK